MNSFNSLLESVYRDINAGFRDVERYRPERDPNRFQPYRGRVWERFGPDSPVYGVNVVIPIDGCPDITVDHVDPPPHSDGTMVGYNTYKNWPTDEQLDAMTDDDSLISLLPTVTRVRFEPHYSEVVGLCTVEELPYVLLAMTKTVEAIRS